MENETLLWSKIQREIVQYRWLCVATGKKKNSWTGQSIRKTLPIFRHHEKLQCKNPHEQRYNENSTHTEGETLTHYGG